MRDNYIIGILLGIPAARAGFWEYSNAVQPILVALLVTFVVAWLKRVLEDDLKYLAEMVKGGEER